MNIGFYRYSLLNRGGDRVVVDYANYLVQRGHRVVFFLARMETSFPVNPEIRIDRAPSKSRLGFMLNVVYRDLGMNLVVVDIIHLAALVGRKNPVLYFAQADDVEYYRHPLARKIMDLLYRQYFSRGRPVITVSDNLTHRLTKRYHPAKCITVNNGINLETFFPDPDAELIARKGNRRAIIFMSRGDHFRKGYDIAMQVLTTIPESLRNRIELWNCGTPQNQNSFPFPVRNFGVVSDSKLRQLLSSADLLFYPSRHEGFGLFPLEAMACGCAVLSTSAIPYAAAIPALQAGDANNVNGLLHRFVSLVESEKTLDDLKALGPTSARAFDIRSSRECFETSLLEILHSQSISSNSLPLNTQ